MGINWKETINTELIKLGRKKKDMKNPTLLVKNTLYADVLNFFNSAHSYYLSGKEEKKISSELDEFRVNIRFSDIIKSDFLMMAEDEYPSKEELLPQNYKSLW